MLIPMPSPRSQRALTRLPSTPASRTAAGWAPVGQRRPHLKLVNTPDNSVTSATLSVTTVTFNKPNTAFDLDLSPLRTGGIGGLDQTAVDARVSAGVADWDQADNNGPIDCVNLVNAPDNSVTSATLSEGTATFALDLTDLQTDSRFVGIAYDHAEHVPHPHYRGRGQH